MKNKKIKGYAVLYGFKPWDTLEFLALHGLSQFPIFASKQAAKIYIKNNFKYKMNILPILITPIRAERKLK